MAVPQGFDLPFRMFSEGSSPNVVEGDEVLDRSIRMILLTYPGERPYRPTFGSLLKSAGSASPRHKPSTPGRRPRKDTRTDTKVH